MRRYSYITMAVSFFFRCFFLNPAFLSMILNSVGNSLMLNVCVIGSQPLCYFRKNSPGFDNF